ncbi:uncharacterized protein LOC134363733 [Cynocephalus volans]|uniref:uncharacterized protein LOC134363733 n=1 Tax=Cynocephalus volans TaxID=110931 RepID=UPI002FC783F9
MALLGCEVRPVPMGLDKCRAATWGSGDPALPQLCGVVPPHRDSEVLRRWPHTPGDLELPARSETAPPTLSPEHSACTFPPTSPPPHGPPNLTTSPPSLTPQPARSVTSMVHQEDCPCPQCSLPLPPLALQPTAGNGGGRSVRENIPAPDQPPSPKDSAQMPCLGGLLVPYSERALPQPATPHRRSSHQMAGAVSRRAEAPCWDPVQRPVSKTQSCSPWPAPGLRLVKEPQSHALPVTMADRKRAPEGLALAINALAQKRQMSLWPQLIGQHWSPADPPNHKAQKEKPHPGKSR